MVNILYPAGTFRRTVAETFYFLLFDWKGFKTRKDSFLAILRHRGIRRLALDAIKGRGIFQGPPFPESALAHKYCLGKGLEIGGSAHNPFGLNTLDVDFTDSMDTKFKKGEIRCCGQALKVDIVAPGDDIPLPDQSQDFIVSSHVIEHFTNPIKALIEWDRLVKPGGIIFIIVPHKERTFDREQKCTSLQHLITDFQNNATQPHADPNGHNHYWITQTFKELVKYLIDQFHMSWQIAEIQDVDDKVGNGFTVVIRKNSGHQPVKAAQAVQ